MSTIKTTAADQQIFGHKPALFVLFFTEMWERFSYYGMRALLVLFLTASLLDDGWGWSRANALQLYGAYTGLVYLTPILGGIIADKLLGYRWAVVLGAFIMTLGHASMAVETPTFFYLGLAGLIIGNGLFKPNISSIVGQLYSDEAKRKDGAYTIFYMGINAGAFLGILLCGYIGEKVGWSYGFGLAGIFMFFGMLQFYFAQKIFGAIGLSPKQAKIVAREELSKAARTDEPPTEVVPANVARDRVIVIGVFAFFTIFFWWAFEQAGGSMTIFAADYTDRVLTGGAATAFNIINTLLVIVPLGVITWVLLRLFRITFKRFALSNIWLGISFIGVWLIALWLIQNDWSTTAYAVSYQDANGTAQTTLVRSTENFAPGASVQLRNNPTVVVRSAASLVENGDRVVDGYLVDGDNERGALATSGRVTALTTNRPLGLWKDVDVATVEYQLGSATQQTEVEIDEVKFGKEEFGENEAKVLAQGQAVSVVINDAYSLADADATGTLPATIVEAKSSEVEIAASWFGILNSFFIIIFAPLFGRFWQTGIITSGPIKFALGLTLLGLGFGFLSFGSLGIPVGAKVAGVSIIWLILAYLFHTLGELCVSPVGLSYVSKLAPVKLVGLMFGIWFIANFIANSAAGFTGALIDPIVDEYGMATFFFIFTAVPLAAALVLVIINGWMKKMMHGIE